MEEIRSTGDEENASQRTDELMDLLIRDPDSLCKDDLERLCEAISRDALSTKNAIANAKCSPTIDYSNPGAFTSIASHSITPTTQEKQVPQLNKIKMVQSKPAAPTVINMASGDGLQTIPYQNRYLGDEVFAQSSSGNIATSVNGK